MLVFSLLAAVSLIALSFQKQLPPRDYENNNYFLVELDTTTSQKPLIEFIEKYKSHYTFDHQLPLDNYYVFKINKSHPHNTFLGNLNSEHSTEDVQPLMKRDVGFEDVYDDFMSNDALKSIHLLPPKRLVKRESVPVDTHDIESSSEAKNRPQIELVKQKLEEVTKRLEIKDPMFERQWHLINTFHPGNDINVADIWLEGKFGKGVVIAVVDDGLDITSDDLHDNFNSEGSWDFNDNSDLPLPRHPDDYHGTRCAGEVAAVKNDFCGLGVAFKSQVSGIRILSGRLTNADEASAMVYGLDTNDIYSCSWGPIDDGKTLSEPHPVVKKAMLKGIIEGRDSKGALYVFASGNGGRYGDSCNFDGYANSIYTITVGAIDFQDQYAPYSETCSALMVVTYSSGSGEHIHTTDLNKKCTEADHGGTSAAAPLASGIYALALSVNPELTWRDIQYINVLSAVPVNEDDGIYQITSIGRKYSHQYGYGKLDATKLVHLAETWKNVKPQAWYYSDVIEVQKAVTSLNEVIKSSVVVTEEDLKLMNVARVEHITVKTNIRATYRGKVGMKLTSPHGVVSYLATYRPLDASMSGFLDWQFMSVAHWGESGVGEWKVEVYGETSITFVDWQLRIFGESIDASKATKFDLKADYAEMRRKLKNEQVSAMSETPSSVLSSTLKSSTSTMSQSVSPTSTSTSMPVTAPKYHSSSASMISTTSTFSKLPITILSKSSIFPTSTRSANSSRSSISSRFSTLSVLSSLSVSSTLILSSAISAPSASSVLSSSSSVLSSISFSFAAFFIIFILIS
ncbi:uncharacterized protein SPAPADRAFT_139715 [Spathaspora passalidarum NRRL Y-27907]|uniref:P/Homo B domain-containing protein n=1 Tax=Spathaspora passalidarum (strain NRRL Y-27907 / 11-Y1) TaxID=619300 RepID=G3APZ7_SPAPN|nr:uncharacterized protein SPAPADRAFT_139715 [Spathaspora passalidarum NRRL Y-27907]EGW32318.1 hypothetical protein SPAPADRAFT_139715 [Spathaspora passalidarum NRRL Y-27907]